MCRGLCRKCYHRAARAGEIQLKQRSHLGPRMRRSALQRRLLITLRNIQARCSDPRVHGYSRYGGRGILHRLSLEDLEFLWHRDEAEKLEHPSIDRIDNDGHYERSNCRFIERRANKAPAGKCCVCGIPERGRRYGRCIKCRYVHPCLGCKKLFDGRAHYCNECRFETRPCHSCGKLITRAIRGGNTYRYTDKWFCSKQEFGRWWGLKNRKATAAID